MSRTGVLPKQMLRELCEAGYVTGVGEQYLNPASIDLPLADEAYRLESIFLPRVMVPPYLSAELRAIDPRLGEFRSHAAGYIDPGWGCGTEGEEHGRPITLEVIPQEDMLVRDGQTVARIRYECMKEVPEVVYDAAISNYTDQYAARLSKHFKKS